jgi:hypothetical protein
VVAGTERSAARTRCNQVVEGGGLRAHRSVGSAIGKETVFPMLMKIIKWASLPLLLIGSIFSGFAAAYELQLNFALCLGALVVVERAVSSKAYFWAAGFGAVAIVFCPMALATRVLLLTGYTGIAACATLYTASKRQPVRAAQASL